MPGHERAHLTLEAEDRAPHERGAGEFGGIVRQVPGREVVRTVDDEVVGGEETQRIVRGEPVVDRRHRQVRVETEEGIPGRFDLGPTDVGVPVEDLALEIRGLHLVVIDDADVPDARRAEVLEHRSSEPAGPDDEHAGPAQAPLPDLPDLGQAEVPGIAGHLLPGELRDGLDERGEGRRAAHGPITRFSTESIMPVSGDEARARGRFGMRPAE